MTLIPVCRIVGHLGSGQFGRVEKALWKRRDGKEVWVAVKALQPGASETEKIKLLQEAATMGQFKHINVLALCGLIPGEGSVSHLAANIRNYTFISFYCYYLANANCGVDGERRSSEHFDASTTRVRIKILYSY